MAVYNPLTANFHVHGTRRKFSVARTTRCGVLREFKIPLTTLLYSRTRATDRKGKEDDTRPTDSVYACAHVEEGTYFINREEESLMSATGEGYSFAAATALTRICSINEGLADCYRGVMKYWLGDVVVFQKLARSTGAW